MKVSFKHCYINYLSFEINSKLVFQIVLKKELGKINNSG